MKKLIIIAPNDRYNYGDLLFSYVIRENLAGYYDEVVNVSTIDADLTKVGGDKVSSISTVYNLSGNFDNDVIIAGGESFCSKWRVCVSYLSPVFGKFLKMARKIVSGLFRQENLYNRIADSTAKTIIGGKTFFPYTIGKSELSHVRYLFYNSLGGSFIKNKTFPKKVLSILKSVDYLALRDRKSLDLVKSSNLEAELFPDCAVQMSDLFSNDYLEKSSQSSNVEFVNTNKNGFIVFQINKRLGSSNFTQILSMIRQMYQRYQKKIYLCPVGFALGHEDDLILRRINSELHKEGIVFYNDHNTIWDIMFIISSSSLYIGTSLHGAITAMSYGVPYIGVLVNKTIQYVKEWGVAGLPTTSSSLDIVDQVEILLNAEKDIFYSNSINQKELVAKSFRNMIEVIKR